MLVITHEVGTELYEIVGTTDDKKHISSMLDTYIANLHTYRAEKGFPVLESDYELIFLIYTVGHNESVRRTDRPRRIVLTA